VLSKTLFEINATTAISVGGLTVDAALYLHVERTDAAFSLTSRASLPIVGFVELDGAASSATGFWMQGAYDLHFLVVRLRGAVEVSVPAGSTAAPTFFNASGSADFCLLGIVSFIGEIAHSTSGTLLRAGIDASIFGSSIRLGGLVEFSEDASGASHLSATAQASLPSPIGSRSFSFSYSSSSDGGRRLAQAFNATPSWINATRAFTNLSLHNSSLAPSPPPGVPPSPLNPDWGTSGGDHPPAPPVLPSVAVLSTSGASTDPCELHSTASVHLGGILNAEITISVAQATGFAIHAYAQLLGESVRFDGTISDSGFSVKASRTLTASLDWHTKVDCNRNGCEHKNSALCAIDYYILDGCYYELLHLPPKCQHQQCSLSSLAWHSIEGYLLPVGSFTATYEMDLSSAHGVKVDAVVTYTPSSTAKTLFSLHHDTYVLEAMEGSVDASGEIQLRFTLPRTLGEAAEWLGLISDATGPVCMSATHPGSVAACV